MTTVSRVYETYADGRRCAPAVEASGIPPATSGLVANTTSAKIPHESLRCRTGNGGRHRWWVGGGAGPACRIGPFWPLTASGPSWRRGAATGRRRGGEATVAYVGGGGRGGVRKGATRYRIAVVAWKYGKRAHEGRGRRRVRQSDRYKPIDPAVRAASIARRMDKHSIRRPASASARRSTRIRRVE